VSRRLQNNEAGRITERRIYFFNHGHVANIVSDTPANPNCIPPGFRLSNNRWLGLQLPAPLEK